MTDPRSPPHALELLPPRKLIGRVVTILNASGRGRLGFRSSPVETLTVDFEGIVDNRHRGWTRKADARVPYLKRGSPMRNDRHLSLVSIEDLAEIARRLNVPEVKPGWIGANVVVEGIARFSWLPRGTHLFIGDTVLTVTDQNAPCTLSGASIATDTPDRADIRQHFPKLAAGLRGLVAAVEHPGCIAPGLVTARLPQQWLYR